MWNPQHPDDFTQFSPSDMPDFLDWWEQQHTNAIALQLTGAFIEGVSFPYLEAIASGAGVPTWLETMLRWRLAAQWAYQVGLPISQQVQRGLPGLLPFDMPNYPDAFRITPQQIAEVPPQLRQAFLEGARFSLQWVKRLSDDAREQMRGLMAINTLANRNPKVVVPLLEQVLRRDLAARSLRADSPGGLTPAQIQEWVQQAEFKVLQGIATRAELISQTEGMRMTNLGILTSMEQQGEELCFVMPHSGSCPECQRLIDGKVFRIAVLKENLFKNFGVKKANWVPALPQHPRCRHSPMEVPREFRAALKVMKVPDIGILLEWYGLPGGEEAFKVLGLERKPWLLPSGKVA